SSNQVILYIHRCGRTARASAEGCSIALINPNDKPKFSSLCKSYFICSQESLRRFPLDNSYMPEIIKRLSKSFSSDLMNQNIRNVRHILLGKTSYNHMFLYLHAEGANVVNCKKMSGN
ncbi:hypothetical protein MKX03_019977, partial [Papaver bracteatum]